MFFNRKKNSDDSQNDDRIKVDTTTITTMVGADTVVEGLLKTKSSIRINGTVKGDVRADGVVVLTKTGKIVGTIEAESIIVAGVVEGNMSIRDKVNVEASGEIYGDIITKKFVIDEESIFQGNCIMNRDGKIIPVPPYEKDSDKKDSEKKEDKDEKADDNKEQDKDQDKPEEKADEKQDSKEEKDTSEDKEEGDDDKESEDVSKDSDESDDETKDDEKKDADDTIIIADINEVEAADDIPASDGEVSKKDKKHNKNYVKKSKSLSVEIQN